jgi:geranylgeranyl diphosphate synthase type II
LLRDVAAAFEETLAAALPEPPADAPCGEGRITEAMRYSLSLPGKRIRPLFVLSAAAAVGADPLPLCRFAVGLEMIHAYSLVHDDLPAMDDDDLRRGRPTNHRVFGEGMAILAGDGLLTEALALMLEPVAAAGGRAAPEPALQIEVVHEIARAAGHRGMIGGQAADILAEGRAPDATELESIHRRKTGALIRVAVRAGARMAGASLEQIEALDRFAAGYGLAFQIADDVKDEVTPEEVTGKRTGGDREAGKMTYPALMGVAGARDRCAAELEAAIAALAPFGLAAGMLELLARTSLAPALTGAES